MPRNSTALILIGDRPAALAECKPDSTLVSRSRRVILAKVSGHTVSNETLIRLRPADTRSSILRSRLMPLVVIDKSTWDDGYVSRRGYLPDRPEPVVPRR